MIKNNLTKKNTENPKKDHRYFMGFGNFDCQEMIWYAVFDASNPEGGSITLRKMLSMPDTIDPGLFSNYISGKRMWHHKKIVPFLNYSKGKEEYEIKWQNFFAHKHLWKPSITAFREFNKSVPQTLADEKQKRYYDTAIYVKAYLEKVLEHLDESDRDAVDNKKWIAAGMYVLVAFFVQNHTRLKTVRFCQPPQACNPVGAENGFVITPDVVLHTPETDGVLEEDMERFSVLRLSKCISKPHRTEPRLPPKQEGVLATYCPNCQEKDLFFHKDPVRFWNSLADGLGLACIWLCGICGLGALLLLILDIPCREWFPAYSKWMGYLAARIFPNLIAGFSNNKDMLFAIAGSGLVLCPCFFVLSFSFLIWIDHIRGREKEKGYRWISYQCNRCGCKYKEKVSLECLCKKQNAPFYRTCALLLALILFSSYFIGRIMVELVVPAYYGLIPFMAILLPTVLLKNFIKHKLLAHSEHIFPVKWISVFGNELRNDFYNNTPVEDEEDEEGEKEDEEQCSNRDTE